MSHTSRTFPGLQPIAVSQILMCSSTEDGTSVCWVRVSGELDLAVAPALTRRLEDALATQLTVVDLRDVSFIDSAGVYAIVTAARAAASRDRRLIVLRPRPPMDRVFRQICVDRDVEIIDLPQRTRGASTPAGQARRHPSERRGVPRGSLGAPPPLTA